MNIHSRKIDFPVFRNNPDLVYLDYAATTFMPDNVITAWNEYHCNTGVGYGRGSGLLADHAKLTYQEGKANILNFFDAEENYDIAFSKNATESLNIMACSARVLLSPGDIILMTPLEHHSNLLPWKKVADETGACLVQLPAKEDGTIDYAILQSIDPSRVKVASMTYISNVNGYKLDIARIKDFKNDTDAFFILDISQAAGHQPISCREISADAYILSAHKMYGPKNIGGAIIKKDKLSSIQPLLQGGGMVWDAMGSSPVWIEGIAKLEAGTQDIGLVHSWSAACSYLRNIGMERIWVEEQHIWKYLKKTLRTRRVEIVPGGEPNPALCSFSVKGMHPHDLGLHMKKHNIVLRYGHMCAQAALQNLRRDHLTRISWGIGTSSHDIDMFISAIDAL